MGRPMTAPLRALDALHVTVEDHVATVVLRAAGKASRMGPAFWAEMPEAFAWLDAAPEVRAVVLRGEGEHFSFGLDLATMGGELSLVVGDGALAKERTDFLGAIERLQRAMSCVAACRKPVVAAIAGWCVGGGVDLVTACDVRLCAADAKFSVREVKIAMVSDEGTMARLSGDDVDAARALRIGLVEDVYDSHGALFEAATGLARRIAANPPLVVQGVKQVLNAASERAAAESLRTVALWNAAFLPSHDLREAMASFMEKRAPKFEGR